MQAEDCKREKWRVIRSVNAALRSDQEAAPIHHRYMVARDLLGTTTRPENVYPVRPIMAVNKGKHISLCLFLYL